MKNSNTPVLGIDLNHEFAQLSYASGDISPRSASTISGSELYQIPIALFRPKADSWLFGREALIRAKEEGKVPFTGLLDRVYENKPWMVDGEEMDAIELLALFLRRILSILPGEVPPAKVSRISLCAIDLNEERRSLLMGLEERLKLPGLSLNVIDRREAAFSYVLGQSGGMKEALLIGAGRRSLEEYSLSINKDFHPAVAMVEKKRRSCKEENEVYQVLDEAFKYREYGTVYLVGEYPEREWDQERLRGICRGKRVFQGNNLFSLGAAFHALALQFDTNRDVLFLKEGQIRCNLALEVMEEEKKKLLPLIDMGTSARNLKMVMELYLEGKRGICLKASSADRPGELFSLGVSFSGIPEKEGFPTRVRLTITATSASRIILEAEDLGMGELLPSSGVTERMTLRFPETGADFVREGESVPGDGEEDYSVRLPVGKYGERPYEEKRTRIRVYSIEELALLICQSAHLLDESLMDEEIIKWAQTELGLPDLSSTLKKLLARRCGLWEFAEVLLNAAGVSSREKRKALTALRKTTGKDPLERRKDQALQLAQMGKYGSAMAELYSILEETSPDRLSFRSELLHDMGVLEAQSFRFLSAADFFYQAYELDRDEESYQAYVLALRLGRTGEEYVRIAADTLPPAAVEECEKKLKSVGESWADSPGRKRLDHLLELRLADDPIQYYEECGKLIDGLREEYRDSMG